MSPYIIKQFTIDHYDEMLLAWKAIPGIGLSSADVR